MTSRRQAVFMLLVAVAACGRVGAEDKPAPKLRPLLMGFTGWPSDLSVEGFVTAREFAHQHGDIASVMFIGGIPSPEALENRPFSKDVENHFAYRPPGAKKLFLSISPLSKDRSDPAPYWGERAICRCLRPGTVSR